MKSWTEPYHHLSSALYLYILQAATDWSAANRDDTMLRSMNHGMLLWFKLQIISCRCGLVMIATMSGWQFYCLMGRDLTWIGCYHAPTKTLDASKLNNYLAEGIINQNYAEFIPLSNKQSF